VPAEPWAVKVFQRHRDDDPTELCPAEEFLNTECPESVRDDLIAIVDAVAESPPPQFTGGGLWEAMHGDMAGFYEARTRGPDRRLYRLFCVLEREAPGLEGPSIIVIAGLSKPVGTALSSADYARIRALGEEYRRRVPRNAL
jgi:hypothetical protein